MPDYYPDPPSPLPDRESFTYPGVGEVADEAFPVVRGGSGDGDGFYEGPFTPVDDPWGVYRVDGELLPFNIHGFLTVPEGGSYDLSAFFGVQIVPPGNAYRTAWRLHTDACGYTIEYYTGSLDDEGKLIAENPDYPSDPYSTARFVPESESFVSDYFYPEGIYLQLGVIIDGILTWADRTPCIAGGDQTP